MKMIAQPSAPTVPDIGGGGHRDPRRWCPTRNGPGSGTLLEGHAVRRISGPTAAARTVPWTQDDGGAPMNWDRIEGNWKEFAGKLREKYGQLTDDEIEELRGKREHLVGELQKKVGKSRDEVANDVEDIGRNMH